MTNRRIKKLFENFVQAKTLHCQPRFASSIAHGKTEVRFSFHKVSWSGFVSLLDKHTWLEGNRNFSSKKTTKQKNLRTFLGVGGLYYIKNQEKHIKNHHKASKRELANFGFGGITYLWCPTYLQTSQHFLPRWSLRHRVWPNYNISPT